MRDISHVLPANRGQSQKERPRFRTRSSGERTRRQPSASEAGSRADATASVPPMRAPSPWSIATVLALGTALAGCGKSGPGQSAERAPSSPLAPVSTRGASGLATKNTTRLGGGDPTTDAAAVARAVYPGLTAQTRPQMVVLTDERDWLASLAASALSGAPLRAPLLYDNGEALPDTTVQTLHSLRPTGAPALAGAQVMRVGRGPATPPSGYRIGTVPYTADPSTTAAEIERLLELARGAVPRQAILLAAEAPAALQMPAAGLAAESGAPILFTTAAGIPAATRARRCCVCTGPDLTPSTRGRGSAAAS